MVTTRKNAIEQRLETIESLWNEFAEDKEARLCRWLVDEDEARMIEVFVEYQNEEGSRVPDLFVRFDEPFSDVERHGFTLSESLRSKYEEIREGIAKEGIASDWKCPAVNPGESGTAAFVRCCASFHQHYKSIVVNLVAVFLPQSVTSPRDWQNWLLGLVKSGLPANVRVAVVDSLATPMIEELAKALPAQVKTIRPELNMAAAFLELARGDDKGGAGTSFRLNFVALTQAAAKGDFAKARQCAASALAIAQEHGWPQMEVAVHMALAGTQLGANQPNDAITAYRAAGTIAAASAKRGDAVAPKLILQSKLGEGAALLSDARHAEAAKIYEEAATIAQKSEDHLMGMESWRMAAYCHEQCKEIEASFRCGSLALDTAERLDPQIRANSTLPYVGQGLLRVLEPKGRIFRRMTRESETRARQVHARMVRLAGPDWEKKLGPEKSAV